jgi:hypothetical protein
MKLLRILLIAALVNFAPVFHTPAIAAICPPAKADGKTIGKITVGNVNVNLKSVKYPAGGVLNPPRSPLNAGVSNRHMPLSAELGSTVIVWHVNLNGCQGKLNAINKKKVGFQFDVTDENGETIKYEVSKKLTVPKGKYKAEWFELSGPRQLVLVTCTGTVVKGSYKENLVIFASPVPTA